MSEKAIYSDGEIEKKILDALDYPDMFKNIYEKPGAVFHNFNQSRENLINWYPFKHNASVLEIGAGMGALTEYLCKSCESVFSIEESNDRAKIIMKRCNKYNRCA